MPVHIGWSFRPLGQRRELRAPASVRPGPQPGHGDPWRRYDSQVHAVGSGPGSRAARGVGTSRPSATLCREWTSRTRRRSPSASTRTASDGFCHSRLRRTPPRRRRSPKELPASGAGWPRLVTARCHSYVVSRTVRKPVADGSFKYPKQMVSVLHSLESATGRSRSCPVVSAASRRTKGSEPHAVNFVGVIRGRLGRRIPR